MTFFRRFDWLTHALSRSDFRKPRVDAARWMTECVRLLTEEATDEDRDKAEQLRRAWLASVEAGC